MASPQTYLLATVMTVFPQVQEALSSDKVNPSAHCPHIEGVIYLSQFATAGVEGKHTKFPSPYPAVLVASLSIQSHWVLASFLINPS